MSFEIRQSERFGRTFQAVLPVEGQEAVLDLIESMREHPGHSIDRDALSEFPFVVTDAVTFESEGGILAARILFQYDADETTIYLHDIVIGPTTSDL